jgi:hypothetical protein
VYNRYYGNSGRCERVGASPPPPPPPKPPPAPEQRPPGPPRGLSGELGRLLGRLAPGRLETEDLLLLAILWLLYRESGDRDFIWAMAAYLFL